MKKLILAIAVLSMSASCVSRKQADSMQYDIDSLQRQVAAKEALIDDVFSSINAITENLEQIKEREGLITLNQDELTDQSQIERVGKDLEAIDRLLEENRIRIAELEKSAQQLKRANTKIKGLEKLITNLNGQVQEQQQTIAALHTELGTMTQEVERLNEEVTTKSEEVARLSEDKAALESKIEDTTNTLNTVHYLIAPEKQLLSDQIIQKRGFIGRTLTLAEQPNMALFTTGDSRLLKSLPIGKKGVELISSHPEESYWLVESEQENEKGVYESLVILDAEKFWSLSKILVISHK